MQLQRQATDLLDMVGQLNVSSCAYDTAWIARLDELGEPLGHQALDWLREHQLPDGSWGAREPRYFHDRVICTLAALSALVRSGKRYDQPRIQRAMSSLDKMTQGLNADTAGETIGFELIAPMLKQDIQSLGLHLNGSSVYLDKLLPLREVKLAALPDNVVNRYVTVAFSAEMAGLDGRKIIDVENLQEPNGSVAHSPSATAYFALNLKPYDASAIEYLRKVVVKGGAPNVTPIDVFESAWVLWNLALAGFCKDNSAVILAMPHLEFLKKTWKPGIGIAHASDFLPEDGDDTSLVYDVLKRYGINVDLAAVLHYEEGHHFRCYELESNPSISTNIHVLGALSQAGLGNDHPAVQKALAFLKNARSADTYWYDKWHISPYYSTAHAVIACAGYDDKLVAPSVDWILETQYQDGAWGYYGSTAEETAYALQALVFWRRLGHNIPLAVIKRGADWLGQHIEPPYPPLWIGKCLYCPELVIRSAILSALILVGQETEL
jgi:halimadienyl-diphosphate synthase